MKQVIKMSGFILISIGTLGLLVSEFIFKWGSVATIVFAAVNVAGFAALAFAHWGMKPAELVKID